MNQSSCRILCRGLLLAALSGFTHAMPAEPEPVSRIAVVFVKPENFTDARRADFKPNSDAILDAIAKFMQEMGDETIPRDMNLDIKVTDIDLAGNFEPWHGPQSDQVRITRGLYPPRIALEFRVIGPSGQLIQSGKRELTDPDYQRYEKDLLHDWFREEFGKLKG